MRHGDHGGGPMTWITMSQVLDSDDPAVALVHADLVAYMAAHPCNCEALCECDDG